MEEVDSILYESRLGTFSYSINCAQFYKKFILLQRLEAWVEFRAKQSFTNFWKSTYRLSTGIVQNVQNINDQTELNNWFISRIAKKQTQPVDNLDNLK